VILPPVDPTVLWAPQAGPQTALLQCPVFEVFYGGARGGGKTDGMIGDWLQHSQLYGENAIGIFVRRNRTQLSEVIARTKQIFSKLPGAKYNEQKSEWLMPGGGRLRFVYLERTSDAENYQGHSYTRVYIEEATNFPSPRPIDLLRATLRSAAGVPVGMRLTGNPGGPGHSWVKQRYIDPAPKGFKIISFTDTVTMLDGSVLEVSLDRVFIPSKLRDNAKMFLAQPTYVLQLKTTGSEALVRAWLDGDWSAIEGAYFSEFSEAKHVLPAAIEPLLPRHWTRFRAMDWGSAKPFCVGWYAVADGVSGPKIVLADGQETFFPAGAVIKYREWYGWNGKSNEGLKMNASSVGSGVRAIDVEDITRGKPLSYGLLDPHAFDTNGGPSIAESMAGAGCLWQRADNKRQPGWEQMRLRFQATVPLLYFLDCCEHTIRTIQLLQHDDKNPEDLDTEAEDHAADETRYACNSRPVVKKEGKIVPDFVPPKLPSQMTYNDLLAISMKQQKAYTPALI
jgi:hypothetical protein